MSIQIILITLVRYSLLFDLGSGLAGGLQLDLIG